MGEGKWIGDLEGTTPLQDAARHVLSVRLGIVREYLPLAVREAEKDPEYVHQLRVATRRSGAALEIFALCLPPKAHKSAKRALREIRRAAGAAREWDVFLQALIETEKEQNASRRPGLDFLIGQAFAQRLVAQDELVSCAADQPFAFERLQAETVAAIHKPPGQRRTLIDHALPVLTGLLRGFHEAAGQDLHDYDHLHRVRILGKRLRYAMEVFGDCFGPAFRDTLYPQVEEMQEILGQANDSHVAAQRLESLRTAFQAHRPQEWPRFQPGIEGLLRAHQQRLPDGRRRLDQWWADWLVKGGEAAFEKLLKGEAATEGIMADAQNDGSMAPQSSARAGAVH